MWRNRGASRGARPLRGGSACLRETIGQDKFKLFQKYTLYDTDLRNHTYRGDILHYAHAATTTSSATNT